MYEIRHLVRAELQFFLHKIHFHFTQHLYGNSFETNVELR